MNPTFVFMQIGNAPHTLKCVESIKRTMPKANIIQVSDQSTEKIEGVDDLYQIDGNLDNLMTLRLKAFGDLGLSGPAAYIDTDMIFLRQVDVELILGSADVAVCNRDFKKDSKIRTLLKLYDNSKIELEMYNNKTFGEALPYVACFTIAKNKTFWEETYNNLLDMPKVLHKWYGDQEAIKFVVDAGFFKVKKIPESVYGCLPEFENKLNVKPRILHFKGAERKKIMNSYY